jgi:hypothetical protein
MNYNELREKYVMHIDAPQLTWNILTLLWTIGE